MRKILIILGISASFNYVVGWACAMWSDQMYRTELQAYSGHGYPDFYPGGPDGELGWWTHKVSLGYGEHSQHVAKGGNGQFKYWGGHLTLQREAGWPFVSLRSTVTPQGDEKTKWELPLGEILHRGVDTTSLVYWLGCHPNRRLPLVPKPLGFVLNAAVYALGILLGIKMKRAYVKARRRIRACRVAEF